MALTKSLSFSLGRKRILISNTSCNLEQFSADIESYSPVKRRCSEQIASFYSPLESLPQEILIKVVCGVDHTDLKQLFHVSKTLRNATVIAKQSHFAYSTPTKTKVFKTSFDLINNPIEDFDDDCEAPNAPKQSRRKNRPRISSKKIEDISIALFADNEEEEQQQQKWPRRSLFM